MLGYAALLLGAGAELEARVKLLRYASLFGAGVCAVALPHVLLPDRRASFLQLLNPPPPALLAYQLRRWSGVLLLLALPLVVLAFYDPGAWGQDLAAKALHLAESLLLVGGAGGYSFAVYAALGARSQAWQEGRAGGWYRAVKGNAPLGFAVPDGLAPALFATQRIFVVAVLVMAAGAYTGAAAPALALAPGAGLMVWAGVKLLRLRAAYDRHFYATNAFYSDVFSGGGVRGAARAPVAYEAVYWTPRRLRPAVWASLVQLDRRLPLGRFVALGHAFLWLLFFQNASGGVIAAYLLLFAALKNGACALLATRPLAPRAFQLTTQLAARWALTRFFVNLRWTLPLLLSLLTVAFFDGGFSYAAALLWTGLDAALALGAAVLVAALAEGAYRRQFA